MGLADKGLISGSSSERAGFYSPAGTARAAPVKADSKTAVRAQTQGGEGRKKKVKEKWKRLSERERC